MSAEALKPLEELQTKYQQLKKEHENFKSIHQEALDKSKLYDTDILDKYTKIKVGVGFRSNFKKKILYHHLGHFWLIGNN